MTVCHEIKSQLAKLLATEDLVVEHKKVETAQFNVHTRVLTLPMWERASNFVYDMLVGHEVGHALYTPDEDWLKTHKIPPQFVNVVEDVRIEKLMKRRYAGLSKTFYKGYEELADQDFFSIADEDVSEMNLADRANLYFKIGNYTNIPIQDGEEKEIINLIAGTETFADVLEVSKILYQYCKKEQEQNQKAPEEMNANQETTQGGGSSTQDGGEEMQDQTGETESSDGKMENGPQPSDGGGEYNEEPEVKTIESLEEALKDLVNQSSQENVYVELPKLDLKKVVVPNTEIHNNCDIQWSDDDPETFYHIDNKFLEFKRSAQKEVNYLVKEFECRKAADSYARATTARTGVLDCSKLHTYKYNEDLFKKVTTLADGKNHGLVFVLDWSGSMGQVMLDTVKQLFNLVWFCKKVSIPFEVYAFTNEYPLVSYDEEGKASLREKAYQPKDGIVHVGEWFSMMNLFTSKVNTKTLENQMKNIFRIAYTFNHYSSIRVPVGMGLSGTPLNEALISLHQIIPQFKNDHKLQKVQCVVLTDGEGSPLKYHRQFDRRWEDEPFLGTNSIGSNSFLRNRKTGHTYSFDCEWYEFTDVLLHNLRNSFTDVNFIGIRVLEPRDANSFIRRYCGYFGEKTEETMKTWKKERAFAIHDSGYHTYFGLSVNALSQSTEFSLKEDATKTQIKTAFLKSLRTKKMNKKVLGEFVELIA
jgi:hypothetical protein